MIPQTNFYTTKAMFRIVTNTGIGYPAFFVSTYIPDNLKWSLPVFINKPGTRMFLRCPDIGFSILPDAVQKGET